MTHAESLHLEPPSLPIPSLGSRLASTALSVISLFLFLTVLAMSSTEQALSLNLLMAIAGLLGMVVVLHTRFLLQLRSQQRKVFFELGTISQDKRHTEQQLRANRALGHSVAVEAEALRRTTLTLTRNWQLDNVLDSLLDSLAELVSFEVATLLLLEDSSRLFVARQHVRNTITSNPTDFPSTFELDGFPLLKRILKEENPTALLDVTNGREWRRLFPSQVEARSCLCVPLVAAGHTLGVLCGAHSRPNAFTSEHLRLARSLSASIAVAIQNARLYEQAQIYGAELEKRLLDLRRTQTALEQAEEQRFISEDKFQSVFRSSPVAFSITTLEEGRFLDINRAFEQRYGFARHELLSSTSFELNIWEDRGDRAFMISQLNNGPVRNLITRLRTKSGDLKLTAYSASKIRFAGKSCVLAVSADVPQSEKTEMN